MSLRVFLAETDVTYWVENVPEWIENSVKGEGLFEFATAPLDLQIRTNCPVSLLRGTVARIDIDGTARFTGFIDEVEDEWSSSATITLQPNAVALKDTPAGQLQSDPQGGEAHVFAVQNRTLAEVLALLLAGYTTNRPDGYPNISGWTVDVVDPSAAPDNLYFPFGISRFDWEDFALFEGAEFRLYDGELAVGVPRIEELDPEEGGGTLTVWQMYLCADDGPSYSGRIPRVDTTGAVWEALPVLSDTSDRITNTEAIDYVRSAAGLAATAVLTVLAGFDFERGSWIFVKATVGSEQRIYATYWGNPLLQTFTGRWVESTIAEVLTDLAVLSGRLPVLQGSELRMVPRWVSIAEDVQMPDAADCIEFSQTRYKQEIEEIDIQQMDIFDAGSSGVRIGSGQLYALRNWYRSGLGADSIKTGQTIHASYLPEGAAIGIRTSRGIIIGHDFSREGRRQRFTLLQEATA